MEKIGIIGSGTWGTAIAVLLRNNGHEVTLWSAIPAEIEEMAKTRTHKNLPGVMLPEGIIYTADLEEAMKDKNLLVMAVPSVFVRSTAQKMKPFCKEGQLIVDVAKGIEENTLDTMTQIIKEELPMAETAVLSGPSHAEEVSRGLPTLCVAGSRKKNVAEYVQSTFISPVFRVYTSPDVLGIETGAALKNVVALAAGIADGLGYGDNAKAALITRGMAEIARLGIAMGGKYQTYTGLSGIGDLIVTCASMHSRNRRAGILIGKGYTMEEAMKEVQMVVEGVYSAKAARSLAKKYNVSMPIVEEVNQVLFEGKPAKEAVADLMLRDKRIEHQRSSVGIEVRTSLAAACIFPYCGVRKGFAGIKCPPRAYTATVYARGYFYGSFPCIQGYRGEDGRRDLCGCCGTCAHWEIHIYQAVYGASCAPEPPGRTEKGPDQG